MAQNDNMVKGLLIGFLAGTALGAIIALLYAPKSGRELRAELGEKADDLMGNAEDMLDNARIRAGEIISDARKKSEELITDTKARATSLLEDADKLITGARQKTAEEGTRVKQAVKAGIDAYKDERSRS